MPVRIVSCQMGDLQSQHYASATLTHLHAQLLDIFPIRNRCAGMA